MGATGTEASVAPVADIAPYLQDLARQLHARATSQVDAAIAKHVADFTVSLQTALEPLADHRCDLLVTEAIEQLVNGVRPRAIAIAEQRAMQRIINQLAAEDGQGGSA